MTRSGSRSADGQAMIVAFRRHPLLPLDDYLYYFSWQYRI